jgi:hypothetical protein
MKLFTTALVAATAAFIVAPSAQAEIRRGNIAGYQATVFESDSYDSPDFIEVYGPNGKESIKVVCAPFDWEATGPNTTQFVETIAQEWCF